MIYSVFVVFLVLTLKILCCGQILLLGSCQNVETMKYFELERFLGKWYQIERFPSWYEEGGGCSYKLIQKCGRRIEFQHGYVKDGIQFILHVNSTYAPGDDAVFAIQENNIDSVGIPLSIIRTDYTNYAIVYGCKVNQNLNVKYVTAWILSREATLHGDILRKARQDLNSLPSGSIGYLESVRHDAVACTHQMTAHVHAVYYNDTNTK